jgi:hypothetical protein
MKMVESKYMFFIAEQLPKKFKFYWPAKTPRLIFEAWKKALYMQQDFQLLSLVVSSPCKKSVGRRRLIRWLVAAIRNPWI